MNQIKLLLPLVILASATWMSCNGEKTEVKFETETDNNNNRYTYEIEVSLDGEALNFSKLDDRHTSFRMCNDGMELSFRTDEEKYKQ